MNRVTVDAGRDEGEQAGLDLALSSRIGAQGPRLRDVGEHHLATPAQQEAIRQGHRAVPER